MLVPGAIIGDVIGSVHEGAGARTKDLPLFVPRSALTENPTLTVAVAGWIVGGRDRVVVLQGLAPELRPGLNCNPGGTEGDRDGRDSPPAVRRRTSTLVGMVPPR